MAKGSRKTQVRVSEAQARVLREVHAGGPRTYREIRSGIEHSGATYSLDTVEDRVHELVDAGLLRTGSAHAVGIREGEVARRSGRPHLYATLADDAWGIGLGLEIGRSTIRAAAVTPSGLRISSSSGRRFRINLDATLKEAAKHVRDVLEQLEDAASERIVAMVVAVPAGVDLRTRRGASDYFPAWEEGPLDELLAASVGIAGVPVFVVNDARARAIAEGRFGLARTLHSAFVLKLSGGAGGSLLRRGRISRGFRGLAGEVGHMPVSISRLPPLKHARLPPLQINARCSCQNVGGQHLEAYVSTRAIAGRASAACGKAIDFDEVARTWRGDGAARRCVEDAARLIGQAACNIVAVCDPQAIVITGRFAACGEDAVEPVRRALGALKPAGEAPKVLVDGPRDGGQSDDWEWVGVQGAGRLAIEIKTSPEHPPAVPC